MSSILNSLQDIQDEIIDVKTNKVNGTDTTLLLNTPKESLDILTKIGLDHQLGYDLRVENEKKAIEHFNKTLGQTYLGESIQELCRLYDLRILQASRFKSGVDYSKIGVEINNFCNKNNITPVYSEFYILAPSEYF